MGKTPSPTQALQDAATSLDDDLDDILRSPGEGQEERYGFFFQTESLDAIANSLLFRPTPDDLAQTPEMAVEESRNDAAAAIVRAVRYSCTLHPTQAQVAAATQAMVDYVQQNPALLEPSADERCDEFEPAELVRAVVSAHFPPSSRYAAPPKPDFD